MGKRETTAAVETDSIRLEEFLPYRLSVLTNTISNALAESYREQFGLGIPEWRVMAVLARFPGSSARELVEHTRMDKVAVSRSVSRLADRKFVSRATASEDRRRSRLNLSETGWAVYSRIVPVARDYETRLLASLSEQNRALLDDALDELQQAAERLSPR
jgi:DNA-binding MarR family transcriptional regulator